MPIIADTKISGEPKALLLADLHLHVKPTWRFLFNSELLQELLDSAYRKLPLILLGDVFEVKDKLDSRVTNQFLDFVLQWAEFQQVIWITGQHDSYLPGVATLEALECVKNITIVSNAPYRNEELNITCIPYAREIARYREMLCMVSKKGVTLLTHMPIKEALIQIGADGTDYLSVKEFHEFRNIISGDIHAYADFDNFQYVGATSQRDWRDKDTEPQIGLLSEQNNLVRIPLVAPRHVEIINPIQLRNIGKDNRQVILKLLTANIDVIQLAEIKKLPGVLDVIWEPPVTELLQVELEGSENFVQTTVEILAEFTDQSELPKGTTQQELLDVGIAIFNDCYEENL
jgi:hypothetical protein